MSHILNAGPETKSSEGADEQNEHDEENEIESGAESIAPVTDNTDPTIKNK